MTPTLSRADTQITGIQVVTVGLYSGAAGAQGAFVRFQPALPGAEGCPYAAGDQIWIDFSSAVMPDGKALYDTVLQAYLSGNSLYTISFGVRGCGNNGQLPLVYRVDVSQVR
jgi:hypothetical protein